MDRQKLAILEQAIEPYRRAGFIITSQSEAAITLVQPKAKFSYLLFIFLLLIWPLAVLYLISFNNQRERSVCLRITSQGRIEESGYTLLVAERDHKRQQLIYSIILAVLIIMTILIILWILHMTGVL
jgi:ABC-type spermidine/putrescine transport system permease subunit II